MDPEQLTARVQELTARLEDLEDPAARRLAEDLTSAVVQMYGAGLERIVELADAGTREAMAADDLVAGLLMIHDLFPVPIEERVAQALDTVRPYMESHGGSVELLGVENGIARLRLEGSCKSCRASSSTLELAVRQALEQAAPDLDGMDVEGAVEEEPEVTGTPLPVIHMNGGAPERNGHPAWHVLAIDGRDELVAADVAGTTLVVANVEGTLLAYRNRCADCGGALDGGALNAGALECPACGRRYFLPQAGRSMDDDHLQLQPVPLLRDQEDIKVAL